ncbi:MAG: hypothetical protein Q9226_005067 [Calogaya cf. arnoldii]
MPLVPSSSTTTTRRERGTQFPENAGSSWSRVWIAQHPPRASRAEVTVHPPSLVAAEEKYPPLSDLEHISPLHQILPLYPLPIIAELPKQEAHSEAKPEAAALPLLPTSDSQKTRMSTNQAPRRTSEPDTSDATDIANERVQETGRNSRVMSMSPLSPIAEAAGVPLPASPSSGDFPDHLGSNNGQQSPPSQDLNLGAPTAEAVERAGRLSGGESDTWTSRLSSMLPDAIMDRPSRQNTAIANTRASRSSSIAPGAYPESDSTEESLKQNQDEQVERTRAKIDQSRPDEKSVRPRKSVSIVLPGTSNEIRTEQEERKEERKDTMKSSEKHVDNVSSSKTQDEVEAGEKAKQDLKEEAAGSNGNLSGADNAAADSKTSLEQAGTNISSKFLRTPTQRDASVNSRASSIAASHNDTDRSDLSTMHERESLAPSETDNSSMMPLLPSSPGDRRSSHFNESLDEDHATSVTDRCLEEGEESSKKAANPPLIVDDSSGRSTNGSPTSSKTEGPHQKRTLESPFSPADNGEGPSNAASSLPPPKIYVKAATSAEESSPNPSLVAPATTPEQNGVTLPRRQTTFALDEPSDDERAIDVRKKGGKLYVRKIRYAILRRPILNAALGRQVGANAKQSLRKLANGELIVIEPPATL